MKKLLLFFLTISLFSFCNAQEFKSEKLNIRCFQVLLNSDAANVCLAWDQNYNVSYIIYLPTAANDSKGVCYDNKQMNDSYIFIGTYTYDSKNGEKTVPAYILEKNFYYWYNSDIKEVFIEKLRKNLSYCVIK